jgi:hypothetical protein
LRCTLPTTIGVLSLVVAIGACASGGASSGTTAHLPDRVTASEMTSTDATTAFDLVRKLRPSWLQSNNTGSLSGGIRQQVTLVYLDGHKMGGLDMLRTINASGIQSMQYLDATRAATVLTDAGSEPVSGAILIVTGH